MNTVEITDVFLRDGLQDEPVCVSTAEKLHIAALLLRAGVPRLEVGSLVNPNKVPQMADSAEVIRALLPSDATITVLALNKRGITRAVEAGATHIQIVTSASESHSQANAGRDIDSALDELALSVAQHPGVDFFAGISTAFVCPFEGDIRPDRVRHIVSRFTEMGVRRIGLADTLGVATPAAVLSTTDYVRSAFPEVELSLHLHNAEGQALETVVAAATSGIQFFDAAIGGYGGCPFAPGAHGNIATEVMVSVLHANGFNTGIDEDALAQAVKQAHRAVRDAAPLSTFPNTR